ncbi:hypothetical protein LVD15_12170 [Fulvivirga maritima]|uniref:hypothetical protein n=1 Tax=Fulvivirga maritima TaxID=2904247 RepID=UPI001F2B1288|nr:hypothetical protein [Fulvivirga maritima]UII29148.1 hypothetical protein LVD15_12170 [Fulvivirga maritima]
MVRILCVLSIMVCCVVSFGQNIKPFRELDIHPDEEKLLIISDYYLEHGYFFAAIKPLQELVELSNKNAYKLKLADAYFNLHCYSEALPFYEKLLSSETKNDLFSYHLGIIYQGMGQYDKALIFLKEFVSDHNTAYPEQLKKANLAIRQCWSIANIKGKTDGARVAEMNTHGTGMQSVVTCGGQEIFAATYTVKGTAKHHITDDIIVEIDSIKVSRLFANENGESHLLNIKVGRNADVGSPFLSADCDRLYYTVCEKIEEDDNCSIYYSNKSGKGWSNPIKLNSNVNQPNSSSKNASLVSVNDGREVMFFSSDRSGGEGGYDLWMSEKDQQGRFLPAKNLQGINTPQDEMTPFFDIASGYLFFSSSGRIGFGGMDVFMVKINWQQGIGHIFNLGKGINSGYDDFHFLLTGDTRGVITSNRGGCNDEVYKTHFSIPFEYSRLPLFVAEVDEFRVEDTNLKIIDDYFKYSKLEMAGNEITMLLEKDTEISGDILEDQDDLSDHRVLLIDESGEVVDVAITDKNGFFQFRRLSESGKYAVVFSEEDEDLNLKLLVKDLKGDILRQYSSLDKENVFNYRQLSQYKTDFFRLNEGDASLSGTLTLKDEPVPDHQVILLNEQNEVVDAVPTNAEGLFNFRRLPPPGKYTVLLDEKDRSMNVALVFKDENGVKLDKINSDTEGEVIDYRPLDLYKATTFRIHVDDAKMSSQLFEDDVKKKEAGHELHLIDHNGMIVRSATSDEGGAVEINHLAKGDYAFVMDSTDVGLQVDVSVYDHKGKFLKHISSDTQPGLFTYKSLHTEGEIMVKQADLCGEFTVKDSLQEVYKVILVTENGKALDTTFINSNGEFTFNNINFDPSQFLVIDDCMSLYDLKVEVVNTDQATVYYTSTAAGGKFVYKAFDNQLLSPFIQADQPLVLTSNEGHEKVKVGYSGDNIEKWWLYSSIFLLLGAGVTYYWLRKRNS